MTGEDSDELVAQQLGRGSAAEMSEVQSQYKDAIKRKLEEVGVEGRVQSSSSGGAVSKAGHAQCDGGLQHGQAADGAARQSVCSV